MPDRTPWDRSVDGKSPLLIPDVDEAEIHAERVRRAAVQAAEMSHASMRDGSVTFLAGAQNRETACKLNIENYPELADDLVRALYQQGKFSEALSWATGELAVFVARLQEAVQKDDDFDCGCEREIVDGLTLCRRFERERVFSPKHNQVVSVKECSRCGDLNIYPGLPERQTKIAMLRAKSKLADDATLLKQV